MLQANISTLQTTLQTNTSSPTLDQVTSSNDLPSSDSRVLVQFNSLAASSNSSVLPSDVAAMDAVVNSTYLSNVDTHVITLDNNTANVSDVVTALRARDGTAALSSYFSLTVSSQYSLTVFTHNILVRHACVLWLSEPRLLTEASVCCMMFHPSLLPTINKL